MALNVSKKVFFSANERFDLVDKLAEGTFLDDALRQHRKAIIADELDGRVLSGWRTSTTTGTNVGFTIVAESSGAFDRSGNLLVLDGTAALTVTLQQNAVNYVCAYYSENPTDPDTRRFFQGGVEVAVTANTRLTRTANLYRVTSPYTTGTDASTYANFPKTATINSVVTQLLPLYAITVDASNNVLSVVDYRPIFAPIGTATSNVYEARSGNPDFPFNFTPAVNPATMNMINVREAIVALADRVADLKQIAPGPGWTTTATNQWVPGSGNVARPTGKVAIGMAATAAANALDVRGSVAIGTAYAGTTITSSNSLVVQNAVFVGTQGLTVGGFNPSIQTAADPGQTTGLTVNKRLTVGGEQMALTVGYTNTTAVGAGTFAPSSAFVSTADALDSLNLSTKSALGTSLSLTSLGPIGVLTANTTGVLADTTAQVQLAATTTNGSATYLTVNKGGTDGLRLGYLVNAALTGAPTFTGGMITVNSGDPLYFGMNGTPIASGSTGKQVFSLIDSKGRWYVGPGSTVSANSSAIPSPLTARFHVRDYDPSGALTTLLVENKAASGVTFLDLNSRLYDGTSALRFTGDGTSIVSLTTQQSMSTPYYAAQTVLNGNTLTSTNIIQSVLFTLGTSLWPKALQFLETDNVLVSTASYMSFASIPVVTGVSTSGQGHVAVATPLPTIRSSPTVFPSTVITVLQYVDKFVNATTISQGFASVTASAGNVGTMWLPLNLPDFGVLNFIGFNTLATNNSTVTWTLRAASGPAKTTAGPPASFGSLSLTGTGTVSTKYLTPTNSVLIDPNTIVYLEVSVTMALSASLVNMIGAVTIAYTVNHIPLWSRS